jgi:hypothetical protein
MDELSHIIEDNGNNNDWDNNFYSSYNTPAQGCNDINTNGICDNHLVIPGTSGSIDQYPLVSWLPNCKPVSICLNIPVTSNLHRKYSVKEYVIKGVTSGKELIINLDGPVGQDFDLYIKFGSRAAVNDWDYRGYSPNPDEEITINPTKQGDYYIMVRSFNGKGDFSLVTTMEGVYNIWHSPSLFQTNNTHLSINGYGNSIFIKTTQPGDLQWIYLPLILPSNVKIKHIVLYYRLSNSSSFISQVRLTETTKPLTNYVKHDDGTDLKSTTATYYCSHVGALQPKGGMALHLRLNFAGVSDQIEIGGIGICVEKIQ